MPRSTIAAVTMSVAASLLAAARCEELPGDAVIDRWLAARTARIEATIVEDLAPPDAARRDRLRAEYLGMLALDPLPARGPLGTTVTGRVEGDGWVVEKLHFRSLPGLVVTANLWRPPDGAVPGRRPAILYVCGHSSRGRDGNKTAFQDHGMWFARHGFVCLVLDTLQLGEIPGVHHGTYREGRFWWQSCGYTPAGVECWNGIRGIDLLAARDDVDPARIGVTGISGGGATTLWIAAADERVAAAAAVSGVADLGAYVTGRCIEGHCDCMFLVNSCRWPWARIATLVAPRPLLLVNSDEDPIFPMDAFERVGRTLGPVWAARGAGDGLETMVSRGGHAYRSDIRAAVYRFMLARLAGDPRPVTDGDVDVVVEDGGTAVHPIPPARLRVFPSDRDIPADARNAVIDREFVPRGSPGLPAPGGFDAWRESLLAALRRRAIPDLPDGIAPAPPVDRSAPGPWRVETEPGIVCDLHPPAAADVDGASRHRLFVRGADGEAPPPAAPGDAFWSIEPRGVGRGRWTVRDPPNRVERSMALLGDTVAAGRTRDVLAAVAAIRAGDPRGRPVVVVGRGAAGIVAAYAAAFSADVAAVEVSTPPTSHMADDAPAFLGILRVADIPEILGALAPRPLVISGAAPEAFAATAAVYEAAGARAALVLDPAPR